MTQFKQHRSTCLKVTETAVSVRGDWVRLVAPLLLVLQVITVFLAVQYGSPTLFSGAYMYPGWAEAIGWGLVFVCVAPIPLFFLFNYMRLGGFKVSGDTL